MEWMSHYEFIHSTIIIEHQLTSGSSLWTQKEIIKKDPNPCFLAAFVYKDTDKKIANKCAM